METTEYVSVVSSGDFIQGDSLGVISQGEYMINIMNVVCTDRGICTWSLHDSFRSKEKDIEKSK